MKTHRNFSASGASSLSLDRDFLGAGLDGDFLRVSLGRLVNGLVNLVNH